MNERQVEELAKCAANPIYFVENYVQIYDNIEKDWIPFKLWPAQKLLLSASLKYRKTIALKSRQVGATWVELAADLWEMIFRPKATVLIFSKRETEALYLLSDRRLRGMYNRLPEWMKPKTIKDSTHEWALENGSVAQAFPTSAGDSYTATAVLVDEADLVPDLDRLMASVKPTIDAGGRIVLISRPDKSRPESPFKQLSRGALAGKNDWAFIFIPWYAHPGRDLAWYETIKNDIYSRTQSLDELFEQYPNTVDEALAPRTSNRRLSYSALLAVYQKLAPFAKVDLPPRLQEVDGIRVYGLPLSGRRYVLGVDPAEGNPNSDFSTISVLDVESGEEMAHFEGRVEPSKLAFLADRISMAYQRAPICVERNNHGHVVLKWLQENSISKVITGIDGKRGWHTNEKSKTVMFDKLADDLYDRNVIIRDETVFYQLASIEADTLRAPEGMHDDSALAFALANIGRYHIPKRSVPRTVSYTRSYF